MTTSPGRRARSPARIALLAAVVAGGIAGVAVGLRGYTGSAC